MGKEKHKGEGGLGPHDGDGGCCFGGLEFGLIQSCGQALSQFLLGPSNLGQTLPA